VLRAKAQTGVADFRPHDMRRTGASRLTGMGVPRLVVSKLLNHSEGGVTSVYDRHSYDDEKRHALETWGGYVERLITGKAGKTNVVALH
jgi:integrase